MCCFPLNYPAKRGCIGRNAVVDICGRAVRVDQLVFENYWINCTSCWDTRSLADWFHISGPCFSRPLISLQLIESKPRQKWSSPNLSLCVCGLDEAHLNHDAVCPFWFYQKLIGFVDNQSISTRAVFGSPLAPVPCSDALFSLLSPN